MPFNWNGGGVLTWSSDVNSVTRKQVVLGTEEPSGMFQSKSIRMSL